jgi:hypothetical protein
LGNSGGVRFTEKARGIGPAIDDAGAIWERGGATLLNRYSPDGRLLASFEIPKNGSNNDQLTRVGDQLLLNLNRRLYTFSLTTNTLTEISQIKGMSILSSSSFEGRVVILINPLSPPAAPVQGRLQGPPAKSKFLAVTPFLPPQLRSKGGFKALPPKANS